MSISEQKSRAMLRLQAEEHPIVTSAAFDSVESYVLFLIHRKAYEEAAQIASEKRVLDWGCNDGYGMEILRKSSKEIAGIDVSVRAVNAARRRFANDPVQIELFDGTECPFATGSFEVVVSFQVIEHVTDPNCYLSEICRVLAPHGTAIFTTPNAEVRLEPGMKPWNKFHVREFTPTELEALLQRYFPNVRIRGLFGPEELERIERNRLTRMRRLAKSRILKVAIRVVEGSLADSLVRKVRKAVRSARSCPPDAEALARFSTTDLFYSEKNVETAIDLMAVCRR